MHKFGPMLPNFIVEVGKRKRVLFVAIVRYGHRRQEKQNPIPIQEICWDNVERDDRARLVSLRAHAAPFSFG